MEVLSILKHPNIIAYFDNFVEEKSLMIVMEYAPGGTLFEFIQDRNGVLMEEEVTFSTPGNFEGKNFRDISGLCKWYFVGGDTFVLKSQHSAKLVTEMRNIISPLKMPWYIIQYVSPHLPRLCLLCLLSLTPSLTHVYVYTFSSPSTSFSSLPSYWWP